MPRKIPAKCRSHQPSYRIHKARNCAVVTIAGKNHYLGPYDSPESHEKYARLIAELKAKGNISSGVIDPPDKGILAINLLVLKYLDWAEIHDATELGRFDMDVQPQAGRASRKSAEFVMRGGTVTAWRYGSPRFNISVHEYYYALARLGGHQNRKHDKSPGWLVQGAPSATDPSSHRAKMDSCSARECAEPRTIHKRSPFPRALENRSVGGPIRGI